MSWAIIASAAGAAISAYSSNQQAKAANKSKTTTTNQTTTQDPYMSGAYGVDLQKILDMQRSLVEKGPNYIGGTGSGAGGGWTPATGEYRSPGQQNAAALLGTAPAADAIRDWRAQRRSDVGDAAREEFDRVDRGSDGGIGGDWNPNANALQSFAAPSGGGGGATRTKRGGVSGTVSASGHFLPDQEPASGWSRADRAEIARRSGGGGAGGGVTGGPTPAPGPNLSTPQGIAEEVARRGLEAGQTPEMDAARRASLAVLGGAGTGQGDGSGTGFGGYNPISDRLAQRLEGDAQGYDTADLLRRFMDSNSFGGGPNGGSGGGGGSTGGQGYVSRQQYDQWTNGGSNPNNNGGGIGDATGTGTFGTQVNKIFSDTGNAADLQTLIDAMSADAERGHFATIRDLDSAAQGGGRFGGGTYRADRTEAQRGLDQEIIRGSAATRLNNADQIRAAKLQALGLVNQRDLGALGARTSENIANSSSAAARAGAADQISLARRGQDLDALGMLLGNEHAGNAELSGLGRQLSSDRLNTMGQVIPGLEGVGLSGLDRSLGGAGVMTDLQGIKANRDVGMAGVRMQGNALNQQAQIYNASAAQNQLFDYLKTIQGIGGMGGTSHTYGQNVQPGLGVSVGGATVGGAAAGAAQGYGLYLQGRG